ncbi:MAG TPA: hypothetical protein EYH31_02800 [Anaerolineae bacterium]|nr:hypothetical protein [Anaerolineae bacterium]
MEGTLGFVPHTFMVMQTEGTLPVASADLGRGEQVPPAGQTALVTVNAAGLYLGGEGEIVGDVNSLPKPEAGASYVIVPTLRNWGEDGVVRTDLIANLLVSEKQQETHLAAVEELVVGNLYPGIDIDYRGVDIMLRQEYADFIARLAERLHQHGKTLAVRVEPPLQIAEDRWDTGAYDWRALGEAADIVRIPMPVDPRAYAPGGDADRLLSWAVGEIDRRKIQIVLPARSVEQAGQYFLLKSYSEALRPLFGRLEASKQVLAPGDQVDLRLVADRATSGLVYDEPLGMYTYRYRDDAGQERFVWLEDGASLARKLQLVGKYHLSGATVQHMLAADADPEIWATLQSFMEGGMQLNPSQFAIAWKVRSADGQLVSSEQKPLHEPFFSWVAPDQPGAQLQIEAAILDGMRQVSSQGAVSLAIATYTPVPSPTPIPATPTPTPIPTPTPAPTPSKPHLVVNRTANLRAGPGTVYDRVGQAKAGQSFDVVGKNKDGTWWQICCVNGKEAWIFGDLVTVVNARNVAVASNIPEPPKRAASAPARSTAAAGFFGYGVQAHMIDNDQAPRAMDVTKAMGFDWMKQQVEWKRHEPSKGNYQWGPLDFIINTADAKGVSILFSIVKSPRWARPGNTDFSVEGPPANPQDFADFLGAMAGRYCGRSLKAIEVWNEQNLHYEWGNEPIDPARYVQLLKAAYNAIKGKCPGIIVVSGALTPTGAPPPLAMDDMQYLEGMYQNGLKQFSDAIGAHPSGYNVPPDVGWQDANDPTARFRGPFDNKHHSWSFRSTMEGYRNIMLKYGDGNKRIWPTEFGWASNPNPVANYEYAADNTLEEQAQYTVRAYQMMRNWGWVGVAFLWNLNFKVVAPGSEMAQWGIVDQGWGPMPVYSALQQCRANGTC